MNAKECKIRGCHKSVEALGMCTMHYRRAHIYGSPLTSIRRYGEGQSVNPLYGIYMGMHTRCECVTTPAYKNYGARGIKVCKRWSGRNGFKHFSKDMGPRPDGYSLDRVNNALGYSPKNCRWASREDQACNTRKTRYIYIFGEKYPLSKACRMFNIKRRQINNYEARDGASLEEAFARALIFYNARKDNNV